MLGRLGVPLLLLLLDEIQLGVVAGELTERDEEVTQRQPELVVLRVKCEEAFDESLDLTTVKMLAKILETKLRGRAYTVRLAKALRNKVLTKLPKNSRLFVPGCA